MFTLITINIDKKAQMHDTHD